MLVKKKSKKKKSGQFAVQYASQTAYSLILIIYASVSDEIRQSTHSEVGESVINAGRA